METMDHLELNKRTRERSALTWVSLDWGGLMEPLTDQQAALNALALPSIENPMAISDEVWGIKERQRDRTAELAQAEVDQDALIAEMKTATGRTKLAIRQATDEYELAAKVYDAKVKAVVMAAREFAGLVEQEQLAVEDLKTGLAIDKEALHLKEITAKIYYEVIQRAQVEADLAKAQVDVAKAHVRAIMADIEAGEAQIKVIEAQVALYTAEAEKATLQADVAGIFAEIMSKQLSTIKLEVGRAEILAGFAYIKSKLDDELAIWGKRTALENLQATFENGIQNEVALALTADEAAEDLKEEQADRNKVVFDFEVDQTAINIEAERVMKSRLVDSRNALADGRLANAIAQANQQTWAELLVNVATRYVHKHAQRGVTKFETSYEFISG